MIDDEIFLLIDQRIQNRDHESLAEFVERTHLHRSNLSVQAKWVYANREEVIRYLTEPEQVKTLVRYCVQQAKDFVYTRNQFLDLRSSDRAFLRKEYTWFFEEIRNSLRGAASAAEFDGQIELLTLTHLAVISGGLGQAAGSEKHKDAYLAAVPCGEYSPAIQLAMLHLDHSLVEPVLDLGCGSQANLVRYLSDLGIDVLGIDRSAPDCPTCQTVSWEMFDYGHGQWGTIIGHQSFSTHFLFNHTHSQERAQQMAHTLVRILDGLCPGGVFAYTPGLPFLEPYLSKKEGYHLEKFVISDIPEDLRYIGYAIHVYRK